MIKIRKYDADPAGPVEGCYVNIPLKYDPCPACGLNRVVVGKAHNCRPKSALWSSGVKQVAVDGIREVVKKSKEVDKTVDNTLSKVDNTTTELTKPKNKGGRPSTTGKLWLAEGISRQAWYKRKRREKS